MRWLIMSHFIKINTVFKFSYFRLWYLEYQSTYLEYLQPTEVLIGFDLTSTIVYLPRE